MIIFVVCCNYNKNLQYGKAKTKENGGNEIIIATKVLEKYLYYEEKVEYDECYALLSSNFKERLKSYTVTDMNTGKDISITNAKVYKDYRLTSETHWYDQKIKKVQENGENVIIAVVESIGEGEGFKEKTRIRFYLIKEGSDWKIDKWEREKIEDL